MKVAVSIWSLHKYWFDGTLTNVDFIKYAAGLGVDGVELLDTFWKDQAREITEIKQVLADNGMALACYAVSNDFASPDSEKRKQALDTIKAGVEVGAELGTNVIRVFGGDVSEGVPVEDGERWITEGLAAAAEFAQANDAYLCLENHGLLVGHSEQVHRILTHINNPHMISTFDMGNFLLAADEPLEALEKLAPFIGHVHAKDFRLPDDDELDQAYKGVDGRSYVGSVLGLGLVNVSQIVKELGKRRYDGWLSIEFEGLEEPYFGTEASVKNLRKYVKEFN